MAPPNTSETSTDEAADESAMDAMEQAVADIRAQKLDENADADAAVAYMMAMVSAAAPVTESGEFTPEYRQAALDQVEGAFDDWQRRDGNALLLAIALAHKQLKAEIAEWGAQIAAANRRANAALASVAPSVAFLEDTLQKYAMVHRERTGKSSLDIFATETRVQLRRQAGEVRITDAPAFLAELEENDADLLFEIAERVWKMADTVGTKKMLTAEFVEGGGDVDELRKGTSWVGPQTNATIKHGGQS